MKIQMKNKGTLTLTQNHFIGQGGEGSIYAKDNWVYKIYHDPSRMIPPAKIKELSVLDSNQYVINPKEIIYDGKNKPIGYTMAYLKDTHPLCKIFTKAFKKRESIDQDMISELVEIMYRSLLVIHARKILVVDFNEMNFLVSADFFSPYFIDVDSYQTPSFPATALMESVRDRHSKTFNQGTDWFSFAVVTFQMFIGVHPYKGKCDVKTLDERMTKNISVFNKSVKVPATCMPFDTIPSNYKNWYHDVFEKGERSPPPNVLGSYVKATSKPLVLKESVVFNITEHFEANSDILAFAASPCLIKEVAVTKDFVYVNKMGQKLPRQDRPTIGFTDRKAPPLLGYLGRDKVEFYDCLRKNSFSMPVSASSMMSYGGRFYLHVKDKIVEVVVMETSTTIMASSKIVANTLEKATKLFDGVSLQNLGNTCYASFFPESGKCYQMAISELTGHQVIEAKFSNGVLMVVAAKSGKYYRFIAKINSGFRAYNLKVIEEPLSSLNFVVLSNGVCLCLNESEKFELFSANLASTTSSRILEDPNVKDVDLYSYGTTALFVKDNKLFEFSIRK